MNPNEKPIVGWKIFGWGLGVLAVPALVISLWTAVSPARRWARMEQEVRALHREAISRSGERPVLRGVAAPGRAWAKYDEAVKSTGGFRNSALSPVDLNPSESNEPALESLRQGAACSDGQRYRDWENSEFPKPTKKLVSIGRSKIDALLESGKKREALELALDLLQFTGDGGRNGSREDTADADESRTSVLNALKNLLTQVGLDPGDGELASQALERADRSFPRLQDSLINSAMDQGFMLLDTAAKGLLLGKGSSDKPSWRFLWSERIMIASAFDATLDCMRRLAEADGTSWAEASRRVAEALADVHSQDNPSLQRHSMWIDGMPALIRSGREHRAQIRLLRIAAHFRATGEILSLDDPFGEKLLSSRSGDRLKLWSVGADGKNGGGSGGWDPAQGADIVLEAPR